MSLHLGALDGRLELKGLLGVGGMGEVHRAWDRSLERAVAVKFLRGTDEREAERLVLEARLQARVEDPRVVRVHEVGTLGGRACIVLQLVEGRSLADRAAALPLATRAELLRQAALGVHAAHRQGLVHRDVKPGNVLVDESGAAPAALVSDFGLARGEEGGLTRSGLPAGTLAFMAPEQLLGAPVDFRADIYGLGATLYAALAGAPPFGSGSGPPPAALPPDGGSLLRRILEEPPPPLGPDVPVELRRVVQKAMEKEPGQRYPTAEALADDLGRFLRGEPVLARPAPRSERLLRWTRRNRLAARALGAAAVAILVGGGLAAWTARRAALDALQAARLGAEAATLREQDRVERLAPAHDLRPAQARLRAAVAALEVRPGVAGTGAGAFAIGTGRELLGDAEGARAAYEASWRLGFRTPEASAALGQALALQYEQAVTGLGELLDQETQRERLAELDRSLAAPARRLLAEGPRGGWQEPYLRGRIALLDGDFAGARARAVEALAADPQRYEALVLEGEAWLRQARHDMDEQHPEPALEELGRAAEPLVRATAWGRSDAGLHELIALVHRLRALCLQRISRDPTAEVAEVGRWAEAALALDPGSWRALLHHGTALQGLVIHLSNSTPAEGLVPVQRALGLLRRAVELAPREVEPLMQLAFTQYVLGALQRMLGQPGRAALEEGMRVAARAREVAPEELSVRFQEAVVAQELAAALRDEGRDATGALRVAVAACEAMLARKGVNLGQVKVVLGTALLELAREDWLAGRDPRPSAARAVEALEAGLREKPDAADGADALGGVVVGAAALQRLAGGDQGPWLSLGLSVLRTALEKTRAGGGDAPHARLVLALLQVQEARRLLEAGQAPGALVAEARAGLLETKGFQDQAEVIVALARLDLLEAEQRQGRRLEPAAALAAAEGRLHSKALGSPPPLEALDALGEVALRRALGSRAAGRPAAPAAEAGLAPVRQALGRDGRDAARRLLEARLLAQAGRPEEAAKAREAAFRANALVKGSKDWAAALTEAGR